MLKKEHPDQAKSTQDQDSVQQGSPRDWLVPGVLLALLISLTISALFVTAIESVRRSNTENQLRQLAATVAHDFGERLDRSLSASYALASLVRRGKGRVDDFDTLAAEMISVYGGITALQLAPGGTISQVVPLAGNEVVIGFSPLHDAKQGDETRRAIESRRLALTGPFELKQGGLGVLGRNPIFIPDDKGVEQFWGLTQVLIRIPDLLAGTNLNVLISGGNAYEIWRIPPGSTERHVFASSGASALHSPVEIPISVPNGEWILSVAPTDGWLSMEDLAFELLGAAVFCFLVCLAAYLLLRQPRQLRLEVARQTKALLQSESQYRDLFESNPVPMLVYDPEDLRVVDANQEFLLAYGYQREDFGTLRLPDLHPQDELEHLHKYFSGALQPGLRRAGEWRHCRKNGEIIQVDIASLEVAFGGRPARLALCIDITERKKAEHALNMQNQSLRSILEHFPGGISVSDKDLRVVVWNEEFRKLLDFPAEMFSRSDHTVLDYVRYNALRGEYGNVDIEAYMAEVVARMRESKPHCFERVRPDGTVLEVRGTPLPDGGFVSSYIDITDRKRDEAQLRAANQRYEELNAVLEAKVAERTYRLEAEIEERRLAESAVRQSSEWLREIIDTMSIGVLLWDKDERLTAWNVAFEGLYPASAHLLRLGIGRAALRQKMVALGDAPDSEKSGVDRRIDDNDLGKWDRQLADGRIITIERLATSEGGVLVLQSDVTALRKTAEVLARNDRMASLGSLVAGVAHEINTPIGNARMVATSLADRLAEFEAVMAAGALRRSALDAFIAAVRESEDLIDRNLLRAANLIQNFKQVAVDQTSDRRREFDLATVLEEVRMTLMPRFKHSPWELELESEIGISMDSFPGALGQVVSNLIENAQVHGLDGKESGKVRIHARLREGQWVEIVCEDDGHGIPDKLRQRIFDPFFTTKLGKGGSGLGLSIVLNLVKDLLGGDMVVESELGKGTRFIITLPLVAPAGKTPTK